MQKLLKIIYAALMKNCMITILFEIAIGSVWWDEKFCTSYQLKLTYQPNYFSSFGKDEINSKGVLSKNKALA